MFGSNGGPFAAVGFEVCFETLGGPGGATEELEEKNTGGDAAGASVAGDEPLLVVFSVSEVSGAGTGAADPGRLSEGVVEAEVEETEGEDDSGSDKLEELFVAGVVFLL